MEKIRVYYTMKNEREEAETCIELPICEKLKGLAEGKECGTGWKKLERAIKEIAGMQGYIFLEIEDIELI